MPLFEAIAILLSVITGMLGVTTAIFSGYMWVKGSARKEYASERDFQHLKRNNDQLMRNLESYWKEQNQQIMQLKTQMVKLEALLLGRPEGWDN